MMMAMPPPQPIKMAPTAAVGAQDTSASQAKLETTVNEAGASIRHHSASSTTTSSYSSTTTSSYSSTHLIAVQCAY